MNSNQAKQLSTQYSPNPAMFSLAESDSHYLVAVDLPTIPTLGTEILSSKGEITVEGKSENSQEKQTIFKMFPQGKGIKTVYMNGVLYLLLPKIKIELASAVREVATA